MMRKVLEYFQSPIYRLERARERARSSGRERLSEGKRHKRVITHTREGWHWLCVHGEVLHINLCKWRLWLYFYKLETTGLLFESEREKAPV